MAATGHGNGRGRRSSARRLATRGLLPGRSSAAARAGRLVSSTTGMPGGAATPIRTGSVSAAKAGGACPPTRTSATSARSASGSAASVRAISASRAGPRASPFARQGERATRHHATARRRPPARRRSPRARARCARAPVRLRPDGRGCGCPRRSAGPSDPRLGGAGGSAPGFVARPPRGGRAPAGRPRCPGPRSRRPPPRGEGEVTLQLEPDHAAEIRAANGRQLDGLGDDGASRKTDVGAPGADPGLGELTPDGARGVLVGRHAERGDHPPRAEAARGEPPRRPVHPEG